jgi:predicted metal-dependent hydrolase
VIVPKSLTAREIDEMLEQKRRWIYKHQAEWEELNATRIRRDYVNGEGFLYLGRSYRLKIVDRQDVPLKLKDGYFCLRSPNGKPLDPDAAFKQFYREKAATRLGGRVAYFVPY